MIVNRQPTMVQMVRRLIIIHILEACKRSISITRKGNNKAQEPPHGLCLLSSALLLVSGYPMKEENLTPPLGYHRLRQWRSLRT